MKLALIAQARPADYDLNFNIRLSDASAAAGHVFKNGCRSVVVDIKGDELARIMCRLVRTKITSAGSTMLCPPRVDDLDDSASTLPEEPSPQQERRWRAFESGETGARGSVRNWAPTRGR